MERGLQRAVAGLHELVALDDDALDLAVAHDLDGRGEEAHDDALALALRRALRVLGEDLDVAPGGHVGLVALDPRPAGGVEVDVARVDDDVGVRELAELEDLGVRERGLRRPAAAEHDDLGDRAVAQHLERVVGDVGHRELVVGQREHARDVGRDVPVADDDGGLAAEVELEVAVVGVAVVPGDELRRGPAAREVLALDAQPAVGRGAERVDDRVVAVAQLLDGDVTADLHVAEEAELRMRSRLLVHAGDGLDVRMVGRDPRPDQTPRGREAVEDVHLRCDVGRALQCACGIEARGAGTDDRDAERLGCLVHGGIHSRKSDRVRRLSSRAWIWDCRAGSSS